MVICLGRGADLHMFQLMPLPLTVSCFSKIQIGFAFLVPADLGSPGKMAVKRVCVCVCIAIITTANLAVGPQIFRFLATKKFTALIIAILLLLSRKADTYFTVPWRVEG